MGNVIAAGRYAGLSLVAVVAGLLTTAEVFIAIVLVASVAAIGLQGLLSFTVGLAYLALLGLVAARVATKRVSMDRALIQILALDLVALPLAIAAVAM